MPPTRLGKYELLTRMTSGGMAEIYAARRTDDPTQIAIIKQMLPQFIDNPEFVEMFLDEGRTVSLLKHPNVVRMLDFGFHAETPYLAMEYLHGVDVRTMMRHCRTQSRTIPLQLAITIVSAACAGLHHAHDARSLDGHPLEIVHRDVSPQNLVLTFEGVVKLIDFGIAKSRGRIHETRAGALKGKVPYMAPEQVRGGSVDRRTDVYAAGVILYELVTGRRPYVIEKGDEPKGEFSLMMAIVGHKIARPSVVRPGLPGSIERIILRALSAQANERYQSAEELQVALDQAGMELGMPPDPDALAAFLQAAFGIGQKKWREATRAGEDVATEIESVEVIRTSTSELGDPSAIHESELTHAVQPAAAARSPFAVSIVSIDARVDETFRGAERAASFAGTVVLDLAAVERISSFGVREWLDMHRAAQTRDDVSLYLARCSEPVVSQLAMIRAFAGRAHLISFLAPYLCSACGTTFAHTFDCERDADVLRGGAAPRIACRTCGGEAGLDDDPSYFAPLIPHLGKPMAPLVREAVRALDSAQQAGQTVEKQVEGSRTRLRFLRPVDRGFRWGRLLDGVEGLVELDLGAARLDGAGIEATAQALGRLGAEVRSVQLFGAPPQLVTLVEGTPRCEVRSVAVEGRCSTCAAPRTVLIALVELRTMMAGGRVTVACRRCDTPLVDLDLTARPSRPSGAIASVRASTTMPKVAPDTALPRQPHRHRARIAMVTLVTAIVVAGGYFALQNARGTAAPVAAAAAPTPPTIAPPPSPPPTNVAPAFDGEVADGRATSTDEERALADARVQAARALIGTVETTLPPDVRAFAGALPVGDVVNAFEAQLGSRVAITRLSARRDAEGALVVRYGMSRADADTARAYYEQRTTAWGATFVQAPPSATPGVIVLVAANKAWQSSDRVLAIDGRPIASIAQLVAARQPGRVQTFTVMRGTKRKSVTATEVPQ